MSIIDWLNKKQKDQSKTDRLDIPGDLWVKCFSCSDTLYLKDLISNQKVCTKCNYHFRITPEERLLYIFDPSSFKESEETISPIDFLQFHDTEEYETRLKKAKMKTNREDAIITGIAKIEGLFVNLGIMDFLFYGGVHGLSRGRENCSFNRGCVRK